MSRPGPSRKTHCGRGHEFTPENTYVEPSNGARFCRQCMRARWRAWYHRTPKALRRRSPEGAKVLRSLGMMKGEP